MVELFRLDSPEHPGLSPYRTMRLQEEHRRQRIFVAEGEKVVRRLLESELEVVSAVMPGAWYEALKPLLEARTEPVQVFLAEKPLLERWTGFSMYQGVLAVGRIPAPPALEAILQRPQPVLLAAVESISSAENIGAVVRTAAGMGADALLVGETCSSPWLRRAVRSSMGTVFTLPVVPCDSLRDRLLHLARGGIQVVATTPRGGVPLHECDFTAPSCLVFGSEGTGLSNAVLDACGRHAAIPMARGVDSLNVGQAAAVFLYEAARQRAARNFR